MLKPDSRHNIALEPTAWDWTLPTPRLSAGVMPTGSRQTSRFDELCDRIRTLSTSVGRQRDVKSRELREYYRNAADRWIGGVRIQLQRCTKGCESEILFFDSNFLVVAVARLREVARMARKRLREVQISTALNRFDEAHPEFRDVRDYQEHILDPAVIGTSMYFASGALVRLRADGRSEPLIDPARLAEDAESLYRSICDVLGPPPPPKADWAILPPEKRRRR